MSRERKVTYDRPVPATLVVRLATGEEWEATADDLTKFSREITDAAYFRFSDGLRKILLDAGCDLGSKDDLDHSPLNIIRYLAETTVYFGFDAEEHLSLDNRAEIAALDHGLRALFATDPEDQDDHTDLVDPLGHFQHVALRARSFHIARARELLATPPEET